MNAALLSGFRKGLGLAVTLFLISGCLPDESLNELDSLTPSPKLSLPLLSSNVSLSEVIDMEEGGLLQENGDNSYSIFYNTNFASEPLSNYFQGFPDQYYDKSFSFVAPIPSFSIAPPPITFNETIPFDFIGHLISEIGCKAGNLSLGVHSTYQHEVAATLSFPDIQSPEGEALELSFVLDNSGFDSENRTVDLTGYTIEPEANHVSYSLELRITGSGAPINSGDELRLDFEVSGMDFAYLEGNFEEFQIPIAPEELEIPLLNNVASGNIALKPQVTLNFSNSFGVPAVADFSNIIVENKNGVIRLEDKGEGDFFHENYAFPYPENRNDPPATLNYQINGENSNINQAFASIPERIYYALGFRAGSELGGTDFIADTSRVDVDVKMEIPLEGSFDLLLTDTLAVDFGDIKDVEELKMLINTENSFPVAANLQIFFLDQNQQIITDGSGAPVSLFPTAETLLKPATITNVATGETTPSVTNPPITGIISSEQFELVQQAGYLLIAANLNSVSDDDNNVKLYSFYDLQIDIAMQVKASLNF